VEAGYFIGLHLARSSPNILTFLLKPATTNPNTYFYGRNIYDLSRYQTVAGKYDEHVKDGYQMNFRPRVGYLMLPSVQAYVEGESHHAIRIFL